MSRPTARHPVSDAFIAREELKHAQYRVVDDQREDLGLGGWCVLCRAGIPGGTGTATEHHEILSKADLPGAANWDVLFSPQNVAPACPVHHRRVGHIRLVWLKAMVAVGLAVPDQYRTPPFSAFWDEEPYPPTLECSPAYGSGSRYFESGRELPYSLRRLYERAYPGFDPLRFCEFCPERGLCFRLLSQPCASDSPGRVEV